jgi:hypothetical protein
MKNVKIIISLKVDRMITLYTKTQEDAGRLIKEMSEKGISISNNDDFIWFPAHDIENIEVMVLNGELDSKTITIGVDITKFMHERK